MPVKRITALVVSGLIPLATCVSIAFASPASASGGLPLCEAYGPNNCVGADSLAYGNPVVEKAVGRNLEFMGNGGSYDNFITGTLVFSDATNTCAHVTTADYISVFTNACSGDNGVIWALDLDSPNGNMKFINVMASIHFKKRYVLSGAGILGDQFYVNQDGANNELQEYVWGKPAPRQKP